MNTPKTRQLVFFILFLIATLTVFFFIAAPYIGAIFLALITATLFKGPHERLLTFFNGRKNLAALTSVVLVLAIILIPLLIIGPLLVKESATLYATVQDSNTDLESLDKTVGALETFLNSRFPSLQVDLDRFLNIGPYIDRALIWLSGNLASFFSNVLRITLSAFLYVLSLFYLFKDGKTLTKNIILWSPLFDMHDTLILHKISTTVISVLRGQLMVGLIQGFLTGLGFWIFGVPNPIIWGSVAAVSSLIPAIGTSFVSIPAIVYLLITGDAWQGIGLLLWAAVAVGTIDNILAPYLMNRGVQIHPFLVLVSVLGGISFFGPIGFIAGPVVLSLLFALLELYPIIVNGKPPTAHGK